MSTIAFPILVQGGLVWLATQSWADLGRKVIERFYPGSREGIVATLIYCVSLTIMILLTVWFIHKASSVDYKAKYDEATAKLASITNRARRGRRRRGVWL